MGTIVASLLINKMQIVLQDALGVRWPSDEMLGWLNDGQREIVLLKPNAYVRAQNVQLVQGTRQALPTDGVQLIDVSRNMGLDGVTPGRAIRIVTREVLDAQMPDWHNATASAAVKHYTYSLLDPKNFRVFPPQPASNRGYVEIVYGALPANIVNSGAAITVDDIYQNVLIDYGLYRAFLKDAEHAADPARAATHQNAYIVSLTGKTKMEAGSSPNSTAPAKPNVAPTTL